MNTFKKYAKEALISLGEGVVIGLGALTVILIANKIAGSNDND